MAVFAFARQLAVVVFRLVLGKFRAVVFGDEPDHRNSAVGLLVFAEMLHQLG